MVSSRKTPSPSAEDAVFDAEELFALAKVDLKKGDISAALEKLKSALGGERAPAGIYGVCGHVYLQLELADRAAQMFLKHLALHPGAPDEAFALGLLHYQGGRSADALQLWDGLLEKLPSYTPALLYRALVRSQEGEFAAARTDLDALMKSTPVEDAYFKPAQELRQRLDALHPVSATVTPATLYPGTTLARTAYGS